MESLQYFERSGHFLFHLRCKETFHSGLHLVDGIVDDGVDTDIDLFGLGHLARCTGRTYVEADDDGVRSCSQHDIAIGYSTDSAMDDIDLDILCGEFDKRVLDSLHGSVHVRFDDNIEFLEVSDSQTATDFFQSDMFLRADGLFALELLAFVCDVACLLLRRDDIELITGLRRSVETEN